MPKVKINGAEIEVPQGTTILRAAELAATTVPYFCYHPGLSIPANCRMCLIEIEGQKKLEPACYTQVRDGMSVLTESPKVQTARRAVLEFILVNHPIDCPICDQAGECWLQDHYQKYDFEASRVHTEKVSKVKVYPIGPEVVFDGERCILCTRCVRFCREISKTSELTMVERGDVTEIRTFPGQKLDNDYSMCTADLCPVGALTARFFRFRRRVWLLQSSPSICTGCARNCSVHLDHFRDKAERYIPRYNPEVNDWWMCDRGRLTFSELHTGRLEEIRVGETRYDHWSQAIRPAADRIKYVSSNGNPGGWAMVLSPLASTESLLAAVHFAKQCLGNARLFRGGRPDGEGDDFLIRADKNANNRGIDLVTQGKTVGTMAELTDAIEAGTINALYLMGSRVPVIGGDFERFYKSLEQLGALVLHSPWRGAYADRAQVTLPAATHAEQRGSFINCDGIVQTVGPAYAAPDKVLPEIEVFARLANVMGQPLPFKDQASAFSLLGLTAQEPPEGVHPSDFHRAPHGPDRAIPGRNAWNTADVERPSTP
jgi:NADH-quinone oxidoreductase subunit G